MFMEESGRLRHDLYEPSPALIASSQSTYIPRMVGFVPGPLAGVKVSFRTYHFSVQFHFGSSVQPKTWQKVFDFLVTRPPCSCHKSVSGPTIFRFCFISVPVFNPKSVSIFSQDFPSVVSCHLGGRPLAGVKVSFSIYHVSVHFHFGSSVEPQSVRLFRGVVEKRKKIGTVWPYSAQPGCAEAGH